MRRPRLFCPALSEGAVLLSPEESRHAAASLRAKPGQEVTLFDGHGGEAIGVISSRTSAPVRSGGGNFARAEARGSGPPRLCVEVSRMTQRPFELSYRITLAVAMTKPRRQGYIIEKCTELGVETIWPIIAERGIGRASPAAVRKWSRRAVEAAKQSGRAWVPRIEEPQPFAACLGRIGDFSASGLTHPGSSLLPFGSFLFAQPDGARVLVFVGPEGGWSEAERALAVEAGALPVTLGPTVLRTETAAVAVCAAAAMCSIRHEPTTESTSD